MLTTASFACSGVIQRSTIRSKWSSSIDQFRSVNKIGNPQRAGRDEQAALAAVFFLSALTFLDTTQGLRYFLSGKQIRHQ